MNIEIHWDTTQINFYKYGSNIEFLESGVHFKNEILSPGAIIVSWSSQITYQGMRVLAQLPLLKIGKKYQVELIGTPIPNGSVLIQVEFFNYSGHSVETLFFDNPVAEFYYPQEAQAYSISLISRGLKELHFKYLVIRGKE